MNTIASKQPSAVASSAPRGKNFNLRAYFAGGAATVALIAAGVIIFGSLAAYVAFNGLPVGGGEETSDSVAVQAAAGAPANAAAALAAAPGAVAAAAAAPTAIAPAATGIGAPGTGGTGDDTTPGTTPTDPGTPPSGGPTTTTGSVSGGGDAIASGPVGGAVDTVDGAASGAGVDVPLSETAGPAAAQVDQTVQDTLDQVGGAVNQPELGQDVGHTVDGATGGLLDD
jgi:hypothetical protein